MIAVTLRMTLDRRPLKRVPVCLELDAQGRPSPPVLAERECRARFDLPESSGKVLVDGVERSHGRLAGEIQAEPWSLAQAPDQSQGPAGGLAAGSNAYSGMATRRVEVAGQAVLTGGEGYLVDPADWSKAFARAQARVEALTLTEARWEPIRRLRQRFAERGTQAEVRDTVRHFSRSWGPGLGGRSALHRRFPRGGPQKQGNRLAGLLHTKGEH